MNTPSWLFAGNWKSPPAAITTGKSAVPAPAHALWKTKLWPKTSKQCTQKAARPTAARASRTSCAKAGAGTDATASPASCGRRASAAGRKAVTAFKRPTAIHEEPIAPNRLAQAPKATAPNQLWAADITYVQTQEGWLYLAAILDLYSRRIVGWAMSERIDTALVLQALGMALLHRNPPAGLLFHSDRGVQYASGDYRRALSQAGLVASMSRKGNCYDNAAMESFWSTLKLELIYRRNLTSRSQARSEIFDYIECFYNRQRSHSALNFCSPVDFELLNK